MKPKRLVLLFIALHVGISARGADEPNTRPVTYEGLVRWHRYSYEIRSAYPYLNELPAWSKIPTLLEWINRDDRDAGVEVAHSQLIALSRVDFGHPKHPPSGGLSPETINYHRSERSNAWARWWTSVGQTHDERFGTHGRQNPEAWKLVSRGRALLLPDYRVAIPEQWVLRTTYRAGDYFGVQTEALTLRRTKEKATLIRVLRKSTHGPLEWEEWLPLTVSQADNFAFAMAYAIDNPWLLKPEGIRKTVPKVEGRNLTLYIPGFRYEFADLAGNIWWNEDPWSWRGAKTSDENFMSVAGILGSVCLLLWRSFPDNSATNTPQLNSGRWHPLKMPDTTALRQVAEDLDLRGEILDTLWHSQRLSDGLEALAEFGSEEQLPAISRLEAELPSRVDEVANLLVKDPNGRNLIGIKDRLLTAAAKAKAAIQKRSGGQK